MPLQVRMITQKSLAEERKRSESRDAIMTSDIAKPIGLLNGTRVGGTRKPKNATWSECVSYKLDENGNKVDAHIFRRGSERKHNRNRTVVVDVQKKLTAADLAPIFAD